MKKIAKFLSIVLVIMTMITSCAFAGEKFVISKDYSFKQEGSREVNGAYIQIYVGQKDVVGYEKDDYIRIYPKPTEIITDDAGNMFAKYDVSQYKPGRTLDINITKVYEMSDYDIGANISTRLESTINEDNKIYAMPEKGIESDDAKIIAKAKELTYGQTSDYKRAKVLFDYVSVNMKYNNNNNSEAKSATAALASLSGSCEDYSILYAALCRALDIPCRVITGFRIQKVVDQEEETKINPETGIEYIVPATYKYEFERHAWNEVYFDDFGWVPVDTCSAYVGKESSKTANYDYFCKLVGEEYLAEGYYLNGTIEYEYNKAFKLTSSNVSIGPLVEETNTKHQFQDIGNYKWAEDAINTLYDMNVIKGYSDTEYGPAGNVSRIEFITMLARVLKNLNYTPGSYKGIYYYLDYDKNHYSKREYDFLMRCLEDYYPGDTYAAGYYAMNNIFGSSLQINKPITRGEVAALMEAFLKRRPDYDKYSFNDIVGNRFQAAIVKAATNGLIIGYEDGSFRPNNPITRAEIAVIIDRYIGVKDMVL